MATPTVRSSTKSVNDGTTPITISIPAGCVSGDVLVLMVVTAQDVSGDGPVTTPSGWTLLTTDAVNADFIAVNSYWRVADGSEGSSLNITFTVATGSGKAAAFMSCIKDSTGLLDITAHGTAGTGLTLTTASQTTANANELLVFGVSRITLNPSGGTWSVSNGQTIDQSDTTTTSTLGTEYDSLLMSFAQAAAGSTGTFASVLSAGNGLGSNGYYFMVSLTYQPTGFAPAWPGMNTSFQS